MRGGGGFVRGHLRAPRPKATRRAVLSHSGRPALQSRRTISREQPPAGEVRLGRGPSSGAGAPPGRPPRLFGGPRPFLPGRLLRALAPPRPGLSRPLPEGPEALVRAS